MVCLGRSADRRHGPEQLAVGQLARRVAKRELDLRADRRRLRREIAGTRAHTQCGVGDADGDLESLRDEGATHVLGLSGNYRGAQYVRLGTPEMDEEEY